MNINVQFGTQHPASVWGKVENHDAMDQWDGCNAALGRLQTSLPLLRHEPSILLKTSNNRAWDPDMVDSASLSAALSGQDTVVIASFAKATTLTLSQDFRG